MKFREHRHLFLCIARLANYQICTCNCYRCSDRVAGYDRLKIVIPSLFYYNVFDLFICFLRFKLIHGLFHIDVLKINEDAIYSSGYLMVYSSCHVTESIMTYHSTLYIDISDSATCIEILQNSLQHFLIMFPLKYQNKDLHDQ